MSNVMNILITNDDGINSEGIQKLVGFLRAETQHRILIVAPDSNRSGVSHAASILHAPVKLQELDTDTWSCSGFPADCVIVALLGALPVKPDLVLSGINHGENIGTDLVYSGTAAAARQASLAGVPGVALSLAGRGPYHWDMAASWVTSNLEKLAALWEKNCFINVNIPNSPGGPDGMLLTYPAFRHYKDDLTVLDAPDGNRYCFLQGEPVLTERLEGSDDDAVFRNYVSVTSVYNQPVQAGSGHKAGG